MQSIHQKSNLQSMNKNMTHHKINEYLRKLSLFEGVSNETITELSREAEYVEIDQGQTLLRRTVIESHAFMW